jgi:hypothetical protein
MSPHRHLGAQKLWLNCGNDGGPEESLTGPETSRWQGRDCRRDQNGEIRAARRSTATNWLKRINFRQNAEKLDVIRRL